MDRFIDSYTKTRKLHHAYLFVGSKKNIYNVLLDFFQNTLNIDLAEGDYHHFVFHNMSVSNASLIAEMQSRVSVSNSLKIFVIEIDFITEEAQNTLLKVLEEPTSNTHFFFISSQDAFLPTFLSRVVCYRLENATSHKQSHILMMNIKDRLDLVKEIVESISAEDATKQSAIELINALEQELYKESIKKNHFFLTLCQNARMSLFQRGAPVKMVLENVMINVPYKNNKD